MCIFVEYYKQKGLYEFGCSLNGYLKQTFVVLTHTYRHFPPKYMYLLFVGYQHSYSTFYYIRRFINLVK